MRAAPGKLEQLLDAARVYRAEAKGNVILMRHSQGDHWDLLLLEPLGPELEAGGDFSELVDYELRMLAQSQSSFPELKARAKQTSLYHIEMFYALAGRQAALVDQRERENRYLQLTGQVTNSVFVTRFGSDVDVFTIGFHDSLASFAKGPSVSDNQAEQIARQAGFKDRADLGFYLRSLLLGHHDTLAGPVSD